MSFQHSAIGRNNKENREWLEKVGYNKHGDYRPHGELLLAFIASDNNYPYYISFNDYHSDLFTNDKDIICTHSDELFRAVTAMREDSDYMQWHTNNNGNIWLLIDTPTNMKIGDLYIDDCNCLREVVLEEKEYWEVRKDYKVIEYKGRLKKGYIINNLHKATLDELIEHFK